MDGDAGGYPDLNGYGISAPQNFPGKGRAF